MKLLVLAQTPPPLHGQSLMVRTLVEGGAVPGLEITHVNLSLSRDHADIGRWRPGKLLALLVACGRAVVARLRHQSDTLYYVPAPGKRGALYRDCVAMLICRVFYRRLILHWHAAGLGTWLRTQATPPERRLALFFLGGADLALVLTPALRDDATALRANSIAVVPNGVADPCPAFTPPPTSIRDPARTFEVLFLGLCCEEKGLFDAAEAVVAANREAGCTQFRLTVGGSFPDDANAARFNALSASHPGVIRHVGFVLGEAKRELLAGSDCLCLPTRYAHEGQPLVLLEALAHGLPIVTTNWRGIAETLPPGCPLATPGDVADLTRALRSLHAAVPDRNALRKHYLAHFTVERHLTALRAALARL